MVTRLEGGVKANGDKRLQVEEGVKNLDFYGDILFEWPLNDN